LDRDLSGREVGDAKLTDVLVRNNVRVTGRGKRTMVFAHGFGCDQAMWRLVAPAFEAEYLVVTFDHVGAGGSDLRCYDPVKYSQLSGYADDVRELCQRFDVQGGVFVGHSVAAMMGVLAAIAEPALFSRLVLVGPSPSYINDGEYVGGFERQDIDELLALLDSNYLGWAAAMGPAIMGRPDRPEFGEELTNSFCRTDPEIAKQFARVTFLSDCRAELSKLRVPSLILQCSEDVVAPLAVGQYLHRELWGSKLELMAAMGHCPQLSAPEETIAAMKKYLAL
jgi:sigma-B regulation protein RsbQ